MNILLRALFFSAILIPCLLMHFSSGLAQEAVSSPDTISAAPIDTSKLALLIEELRREREPKDPGRHHLAFGMGQMMVNRRALDVSTDSCASLSDFFVQYRFSATRKNDIVLDLRSYGNSGGGYNGRNKDIIGYGIGLGYRRYLPIDVVYLFGEALALLYKESAASEDSTGKKITLDEKSGYGICARTGINLLLSEAVSIPFELYYLYAIPRKVTEGWGVMAGISFNFGRTD